MLTKQLWASKHVDTFNIDSTNNILELNLDGTIHTLTIDLFPSVITNLESFVEKLNKKIKDKKLEVLIKLGVVYKDDGTGTRYFVFLCDENSNLSYSGTFTKVIGNASLMTLNGNSPDSTTISIPVKPEDTKIIISRNPKWELTRLTATTWKAYYSNSTTGEKKEYTVNEQGAILVLLLESFLEPVRQYKYLVQKRQEQFGTTEEIIVRISTKAAGGIEEVSPGSLINIEGHMDVNSDGNVII